MTSRVAVSLNLAKKAALAPAVTATLAALIVAGIISAPSTPAQSAAAALPKFEVVSVKPSTGCGDGGGAKGGRGGGAGGSSSPERLDLRCRTVMDLIQMAYVQYPDGKRKPPGRQVPISGGPAWINSARYDIEAKPEAPQSPEMMHGPMLQALLEDRFQVKIHHETRGVPVYALTVAKGGSKLQVAQEGKCSPRDTPRAQRPPGLLSCGVFAPSSTNDGSYVYGTTVAEFCVLLSFILDRDVIDKTGIAGVFDIHIEAPPTDGSPADVAPPADPGQRDPLPHASLTDPLGQAIFSAVQKVGLKLDPAKGPGDFLVIDRVERPSGN